MYTAKLKGREVFRVSPLRRTTMESDRSSAMTRRTLMRLTAAVSTGVLRAAQPASGVMTKLSIYMSEARERGLPAEVIEKVKHHILDTFDFRLRACSGSFRDSVCPGIWWRDDCDRGRFKCVVRADRGGGCQRRDGARG